MPKNAAKRTPAALIDPDAAPRAAFVLSERYGAVQGPWHAHRRAQLIHASAGVLTVRADSGLWVVPPQRAIWVLPGVLHQVSSRKPFWLRTLYAEPDAVELPQTARVVAVDRLAEELMVAASELGADYPLGGPEERLIRVLLDRLPLLAIAPLHLPSPTDPRLLRITEALAGDPADPSTLDELAARHGMTSRTAARRFVKETGLTFGTWRQQLRLLAALERLGAGESVTSTALDVGYSDVSSFIAAFRSALGETPARYFRQRRVADARSQNAEFGLRASPPVVLAAHDIDVTFKARQPLTPVLVAQVDREFIQA